MCCQPDDMGLNTRASVEETDNHGAWVIEPKRKGMSRLKCRLKGGGGGKKSAGRGEGARGSGISLVYHWYILGISWYILGITLVYPHQETKPAWAGRHSHRAWPMCEEYTGNIAKSNGLGGQKPVHLEAASNQKGRGEGH